MIEALGLTATEFKQNYTCEIVESEKGTVLLVPAVSTHEPGKARRLLVARA
jgi:hypothetical protein